MITFDSNAWEEYVDWQEEDKKTLRKINKLFKSIERDGAMCGEGQPEKLKNLPNTYSRRIDEKNRLVYVVLSENCTIMSCKGHYGDS